MQLIIAVVFAYKKAGFMTLPFSYLSSYRYFDCFIGFRWKFKDNFRVRVSMKSATELYNWSLFVFLLG